MNGHYQGEKHCEIVHNPSQSRIETDAPKDNAGKGERFSPTDLIGAALGSCILTTMAIHAEKEGLDLKGARFDIGKEMVSNPRRIGILSGKITLPKTLSPEKRSWLEGITLNCPVAKSLHPDVKLALEFEYL
jgi:uncharacterized OsmC-like protein